MKGQVLIMITEKINMEITVTGSDDGLNTYEIYRKLGDDGKKALVIELYPTITAERCECIDASTMHLINHCKELGWSEVSVVNLYSTVFDEKPSVARLNEDCNNMAYIEEFLEKDNIKEYDIVIAWGSSLSTHKKTINLKIDLISMLRDKGLTDNVKCIVTRNIDTSSGYGVHPLYLGLHFSREKWELCEFPIKDTLEVLKKIIFPISDSDTEKNKKAGKKNVSKNKE